MPPSISRTRNSGAPLGLAGAVLLHVGILAATFMTWSHTLDIQDQTPIVPVDLVTLGDKTNVRAMVKEASKETPKEQEQPPAPQPVQTEAAAPPAQAETAPSDEARAAEKVAPTPPPKVKPEQKPEPKKDKFDINNIMALLDKRAPAASATPNAKVGNRTIRGIGDQTAMTADIQAMLQSQIKQCWSPPVGAPNPQDLIVDLDLFLNIDGSVARPPQLIASSANGSNPYARAALDAAQRAIYECQPYKLPPDKYSLWHEISPFHFDPRQMMGQ